MAPSCETVIEDDDGRGDGKDHQERGKKVDTTTMQSVNHT